MSLNDPLANALSSIKHAEEKGKKECLIKPVNKTIKKVLDILNENNYVGKYEIIDDGRGGMLKINLLGQINKCGVIKPRFSAKKDDYEKFEKRFLPAKDFGIIIVSTNKGIIINNEAKEKKIGGKLIAYCY